MRPIIYQYGRSNTKGSCSVRARPLYFICHEKRQKSSFAVPLKLMKFEGPFVLHLLRLLTFCAIY